MMSFLSDKCYVAPSCFHCEKKKPTAVKLSLRFFVFISVGATMVFVIEFICFSFSEEFYAVYDITTP
jgi:hypothetical protein